MDLVDLVIRNGHVIDPKNGVDCTGDVAVHNLVIHAVGPNLNVKGATEFNANGCIVVPGLIDCHVHCYQYVTPLGINPDEDCLSRGVTTVVDAGSAGACTFPGLRKFVADNAKTRVLCFLNIVNHGLAQTRDIPGVIDTDLCWLPQLDVEECQKCINENRDMIVGVKIRLSAYLANDGKNEQEAFRRALAAAEASHVPLMTHHLASSVPTQGTNDDVTTLCCPRHLRTGDIYTHAFHARADSIVDFSKQTIHPDVLLARERGVQFDIGHGQGSFSWQVAEICAKSGFWPDIISTDVHTRSIDGPAYDLPLVMGKFVQLGMTVPDIIKAVTSTPAGVIGWGDKIGSLSIGKEADITILRREDCDLQLEDCYEEVRRVRRRFVPVHVWRKGSSFPISKRMPPSSKSSHS